MNDQFRILRPYIRGLPIIIGAMIAGFLLAKKYLAYTTPMYESTSKIQLADLNEGVTGSNLFKDLDVFSSSNKIAMEIEVLKSQVLIEKTLATLDFDQELSRVGKLMTKEIYVDKPFFHQIEILNPSFYNTTWEIDVIDSSSYTVHHEKLTETVTGTFGSELIIDGAARIVLSRNTPLIALKPNLAFVGQYQLVRYSTNKLVEKVSSHLDVVSVDKDVAVLRIIYKSNVPEKAAVFSDAHAQQYILDYIEEKYKTAHITSDFLDEQIDKVYKNLADAERRIQNYREENDIINIRQETETDLRKISQMKIQKTNVEMSLQAIIELNEYIQAGKENFLDLAPNFEAFTDLLSTEMIKKIKALQLEKTDLLLRYKEDHSLIVAVDEKIKFYTDYFVESIKNTTRNLQTKYDKLVSDIEDAEQVFMGLPERERILSILDRTFQIHQQSYIFLNEKKIEAEIAKAAKHAFHRIINKASIPHKPVSPNRPIIIIVSTLLGMIGAVIFIFLVNTSKGRINDVISIEKNTDIPILYTAPHLPTSHKAKVFFKNEVLKLDMLNKLEKATSIVYTSFKHKHGTSFHLQHVAEVLRQERRNFLVLTFNEDHGFDLPESQVMYMSEPELSRYTFAEIADWFNTTCAQYDLVLVDNYYLSDNPKALLFMGLAHQNFFTVDTRKTYLNSIKTLNVIREKNAIENLHIVVNNDKYSPSLVTEAIWFINLLVHIIKNR